MAAIAVPPVPLIRSVYCTNQRDELVFSRRFVLEAESFAEVKAVACLKGSPVVHMVRLGSFFVMRYSVDSMVFIIVLSPAGIEASREAFLGFITSVKHLMDRRPLTEALINAHLPAVLLIVDEAFAVGMPGFYSKQVAQNIFLTIPEENRGKEMVQKIAGIAIEEATRLANHVTDRTQGVHELQVTKAVPGGILRVQSSSGPGSASGVTGGLPNQWWSSRNGGVVDQHVSVVVDEQLQFITHRNTTTRCSVTGKVSVTAEVEGNSSVELTFRRPDVMGLATFHDCVKRDRWVDDRTLVAFLETGSSRLLNYFVQDASIKSPLKVSGSVQPVTGGEGLLQLQLAMGGSVVHGAKRALSGVEVHAIEIRLVTINLGMISREVQFKVSEGEAQVVNADSTSVIWQPLVTNAAQRSPRLTLTFHCSEYEPKAPPRFVAVIKFQCRSASITGNGVDQMTVESGSDGDVGVSSISRSQDGVCEYWF